MSFEKLAAKFASGAYRPNTYEGYYEGRRRLDAVGISLPRKARVLELQAPFAKMAVDVLTEILIPDGYRVADDDKSSIVDLLRKVWQFNDMDSQFNLAASEAIAAGAAYWVIAPPDDDHEFASIRAVDAKHARVRIDFRGNLIEGMVLYRREDGNVGATYYTPEGVQFWVKGQYGWKSDGTGRDDSWGASIIPMFNRARLSDKYGRSDLRELAGVIDAASRTLTNLQIAQEVSSSPMRAIIGRGADDMLRQHPDKMQVYMGNLFALPEGADVKQLTGAALDPFINAYRSYALQLSAMTGIPPSMMGVSSDNNPTSAEALRVAKDRLIARAENKQRQFSDSLEKVGRVVALAHGKSLKGLEALEVVWRDAAAPSTSAQMATALQAHSQGIIGDETAREFMHLTPEQLRREKARSEEMDAEAGKEMPEPPPLPEDAVKEEGEEPPANKKPLDASSFQENTIDAKSKGVKAQKKQAK